MKATIDKAGRVVIPAPIREKANLSPGVELEVVIEDDASIRLTRAVTRPRLVRRRGRLIVVPTAATESLGELDIASLVKEERNRSPF